MLTERIIKKIESDSDWQYLVAHIQSIVDSLDSIEDIDFLDKERSAIEGRSRQLAKKKLKEILESVYSPEELTVDNKEHIGKKTGVL